MGRSGYTDAGDCYDSADMLRMYAWNANVRRHIGGKKGQAFMWELYQALEALPERLLIQGGLMDQDGACCSLGAVARFRKMEVPKEFCVTEDEEPDEYEFQEAMGPLFGIKDMLAREVMYQNDECDDWRLMDGTKLLSLPWAQRETPTRYDNPAERWQRVREWVVSQLKDIP
jgi:hypothetical protein